MQELLTKDELAKALKISVSKINQDLPKGLPHIKVGSNVRFEYDKVIEYYKTKEV
jgi:excisionase family DNA binding protein